MSEEMTAQLAVVTPPHITLNFELKQAKQRALAFTITGYEPNELLQEYQSVISTFEGVAPASLPAVPKKSELVTTAATPAETPAQTTEAAPKIGKREAKKNAEMDARYWNDEALKWAHRVIAAVPPFASHDPGKLAAQLGFSKPMAVMTSEESQKLVGLLKDTMKAAANNNPAVGSFLIIVGAIDSLTTGTDEEWEGAKFEYGVAQEDWANLKGNPLFVLAKSELDARRGLLQAVALAVPQ